MLRFFASFGTAGRLTPSQNHVGYGGDLLRPWNGDGCEGDRAWAAQFQAGFDRAPPDVPENLAVRKAQSQPCEDSRLVRRLT